MTVALGCYGGETTAEVTGQQAAPWVQVREILHLPLQHLVLVFLRMDDPSFEKIVCIQPSLRKTVQRGAKKARPGLIQTSDPGVFPATTQDR